MSYFTKDFIRFLSELENNNNRDWFLENKNRYEQHVKKPFEDFVQAMIYSIHEVDEDLFVTPKEAIFRIYRDVRFSKDKTPYKTHVSAIISKGGRKNRTDPGVYIEIGANEMKFYSGIYELDKEQIYKVRSSIVSNLDEFNLLLKDKEFKKVFGTINGEQNKVLPAEFKEVAKAQPLIAKKQFYYFTKLPQNKILSKSLTKELMKYYFAAQPMNKFLTNALG